ncbi:MAG: hypothetical protein A4E69_00822 [Syntrophus sp. PtaB.Bin138]|jgi:hypothetical protein|uniref:hypothetical protein n=1 Tax=Syntrophus sp. (in: bacteria) TaxID=48412 RepID=UPI0009C62025|nr:MAG: hypothetical protein A4E69_00822 [Syntrophus sp. PtaB.Bin138]
MIKKALPDLLMAAIIVTLAFFIAAGLSPSTSPPPVRPERTDAKAAVGQKEAWAPPVVLETALKQRNLFSEAGRYDLPEKKTGKAPEVLPENPYSLVAVMLGKEQKAVFRDYKGTIHTVTKGKTLIDGAVLTRISPRSVWTRKGRQTRELSLFDVRRKPADAVGGEAAGKNPDAKPARRDRVPRAPEGEIKIPPSLPDGGKEGSRMGKPGAGKGKRESPLRKEHKDPDETGKET